MDIGKVSVSCWGCAESGVTAGGVDVCQQKSNVTKYCGGSSGGLFTGNWQEGVVCGWWWWWWWVVQVGTTSNT